jgi:hypothetical protein
MIAYFAWRDTLEKAAGDVQDVQDLIRLMDQFGMKINSAFLDSIRQIASRIDIEALGGLIKAGRTAEAIDLVNRELARRGFPSLAQELTTATMVSGERVATSIAASRRLGAVQFVFHRNDAGSLDYLKDSIATLIRDIGDGARASVRAVILSGLEAGRNPYNVARTIRDHIGLTESQTRAVLNFRRGLEEGNKSVLDRALRDKRFDPTILRSLRNGAAIPPEKIDQMVSRYAARYLNYRAETIARTEALRAVNTGSYFAIRQLVEQDKIGEDEIVRRWQYTHDDKVRDAHAAVPAMNREGVGLHAHFQTPLGPLLFPGDPKGRPENTINCRCVVTYSLKRSTASAV